MRQVVYRGRFPPLAFCLVKFQSRHAPPLWILYTFESPAFSPLQSETPLFRPVHVRNLPSCTPVLRKACIPDFPRLIKNHSFSHLTFALVSL